MNDRTENDDSSIPILLQRNDVTKKRRYPATLFVLFLVATAMLVCYALALNLERRHLHESVAITSAENQKLRSIADSLEIESKLKADILHVMREAASVDDIPDLDCSYFAVTERGGGLSLYVPEGSHALAIEITWELLQPVNNPTNIESKLDKAKENQSGAISEDSTGELRWLVPLRPDAGYRLQLDRVTKESKQRAGSLSWKLESNNPEFETRIETIFDNDFFSSGRAHSQHEQVAFPNAWRPTSKTDDLLDPDLFAVTLFEQRCNGQWKNKKVKMTQRVRLLSDAPPCLPASQIPHFLRFKQPYALSEYLNDGRFSLRLKRQ